MKWVKALRSGKYEQTCGVLRRAKDSTYGVAHCCLGVLCDISEQGEWGVGDTAYGMTQYKCVGGGDDTALPPMVQEWAGMKSEGGTRAGKRKNLMHLNDNSRYTFEKIANIIEKEWKDL